MSSLNRDGALWTAAVLGALTLALVYLAERPERLTAVTVFQLIETIVTVDGVLVAVFAAALWRWPIFAGWLVCVPNLSGEWRGKIMPIRGSGLEVEPISASLDIRQTLFSISCVMRTEQTTSRSFASAIFVDRESGEQQLTYSYSADPRLRDRDDNPRHDGTAILRVVKASDLAGTYFTDRQTRGELQFRRA